MNGREWPLPGLRVRASGEVAPYGDRALVLGRLGAQSLDEIWARGRVTAGWGRRKEEPPRGPRILCLEEGAPLDEGVLTQLRGWLPDLECLELEGAGLLEDGGVRSVLAEVPSLPGRDGRTVRLRLCGTLPRADAVPDGLTDVELVLPMTGGEDADLLALGQDLRRRRIALAVRVPVRRSDWFHLRVWLAHARRTGVALVPDVGPPEAPDSLSELDGDTLSALHGALEVWLERFGGASNLDPVLAQLRRWQRTSSVGPTGAALSLPPLTHPALRDEGEALRLLAAFLRVHHTAPVGDWLRRLTGDPSFVTAARARPSLRLAALWRTIVFERSEMLEVLRKIYGDPERAARRVAADRSRLAGTAWQGWHEAWITQLQLDRCRRRVPPFSVPPPPAARAEALPRVSVILPSYNHRAFVGAAVESVLAQGLYAFELHVVDDGSRDGTLDVVQGYRDPRLRISRNSENLGLGRSLWAALGRITTPYVAVLNSDDLFHPERLEHCVAALDADPNLAVVATGVTPIDEAGGACAWVDSSPVFDGERIHDWLRWYEGQRRGTIAREELLGALLQGNFLLTTSNLVARRDYLVECAGAWRNLEYCLDWQIFLLAAVEGRLDRLDAPLLAYRLHGTNTVWWDEEREWRYYLESGQVLARTLERFLQHHARGGAEGFSALLETVAHHMGRSPGAGWRAIYLGSLLESRGLTTGDLPRDLVRPSLRRALADRRTRQQADELFERFGGAVAALHRVWGEHEPLEAMRVRHESLLDRYRRLVAELAGRGRSPAAPESGLALPAAGLGSLTDELLDPLVRRGLLSPELERRARQLSRGGVRAVSSLARAVSGRLARRLHGLSLARLRIERGLHELRRGSRRYRLVTTACWNFPIYSHTFVYQEILELVRRGFDARLVYSRLEPREALQPRFGSLWGMRVRLRLHPAVHEDDYRHYRERMPEKVASLTERICRASGMGHGALVRHGAFLRAFSFTRLVEAFRPDYLHSYFFYDGSLLALVAGFLLDIPRGVSCYADHRLEDYELKLVPLHLELCELVIATSQRIKRELVELAPGADADRILVKPNAIDTRHFPQLPRSEPAAGKPFRLVCVSRIEPKKGLLHLVEALDRLRIRGVTAELHLVGEADPALRGSLTYRRQLEERIGTLRLEAAVHLEGRQGEAGVKRFLGLSQLFVAPFVETESGDKDGIPTALLEAMATGLPAAATDAGSIPEVIEDGVDGVLVPQADPEALADAIEGLLADPGRRAEMGRRAALKVRAGFDTQVCERIFHDRLVAALEQRRSPR